MVVDITLTRVDKTQTTRVTNNSKTSHHSSSRSRGGKVDSMEVEVIHLQGPSRSSSYHSPFRCPLGVSADVMRAPRYMRLKRVLSEPYHYIKGEGSSIMTLIINYLALAGCIVTWEVFIYTCTKFYCVNYNC